MTPGSALIRMAILFALFFFPLPCEGKITSPPPGTRLTFLPGSIAKIQWAFDDDISQVLYRRWWYFGTSNDSSQVEQLAIILGDNAPQVYNSGLSGVSIEKPATLVLKDVDLSYNGTYQFQLLESGSVGVFSSTVVVFIAEKPTVMFSCSSSITLNEGDNFACVCRGEGGNPPADVTWSKDGVQIGETGKDEQILTLRNVSGIDSGTYKCLSRSHNLTDEKSIGVKIRLNFKPKKTAITVLDTAVVGKTATIMCQSDGLPEPSYTIIHNDTQVSREKTYIISKVNWRDGGLYQCVAINKLGHDLKCYCLTVKGEPVAQSEKVADESSGTVVVWHIIVSLVSGFIIGILFSYIISSSRSYCRWFSGSRNPERNPEPQPTEVDTTYQELDLSKMNTPDNYESLRVNVASNDDNSTYTDLSKTRDEENNYQSLT